jgi:hypothetical protein
MLENTPVILPAPYLQCGVISQSSDARSLSSLGQVFVTQVQAAIASLTAQQTHLQRQKQPRYGGESYDLQSRARGMSGSQCQQQKIRASLELQF